MTGKKELIVSPVYNDRDNIVGQEYHGEVIRCRDCRHHVEKGQFSEGYCVLDARYWKDEDYCSRAERRSDD